MENNFEELSLVYDKIRERVNDTWKFGPAKRTT